MDKPPVTTDVPLNAPDQPRLYLSTYIQTWSRVHMWALQAENNNNFDFFWLFPLEFGGIFLLACEFFVDYYILFNIQHMLTYLTLS